MSQVQRVPKTAAAVNQRRTRNGNERQRHATKVIRIGMPNFIGLSGPTTEYKLGKSRAKLEERAVAEGKMPRMSVATTQNSSTRSGYQQPDVLEQKSVKISVLIPTLGRS